MSDAATASCHPGGPTKEEQLEATYAVVLQELSTTPGARYSCIADAATRTILAERGVGDVDPVTVLGWGDSVVAGLADGDEPDALDDLIVTAARSYHLLRLARASAVHPPLLVYVCLDRARSNLALARRALSSVVADRLDNAPASAEQVPAPPPATPPVVPAPPAAAVPAAPRPASPPVAVPLPRRSPAPVQAAAPVPPARSTGPRWADDVSTMRRLLAGLRTLGNGS